ncbi:MAG: GGDEF domain-containing protein [Burkholderiales bacterium]|nr:GGDEF domain-containing protein [Burkholderiales bacterium]
MGRISQIKAWSRGPEAFNGHEEHVAFQFRLVLWLMLCAAGLALLLLAWLAYQPRPGLPGLVPALWVYAGLSLGAWWWLRGHRQHLLWVSWCALIGTVMQNTATWFLLAGDELRVLWFFTGLCAAYMVVGRLAGAVITTLIVVTLWVGNGFNPTPYSHFAMFTLTTMVVFLAVFFHLYVGRSQLYYARMQASNLALQQLASHDPLTGTLNARAFGAEAERQLSLAGRRGADSALLFIDLDHFKRINDTHGHSAGDVVLRSVAQCLQTHLRGCDLLGRVGGEEFAVFLPDTHLHGATHVAEGLRQAVSALRMDMGVGSTLAVTASLGVAAQRGGAFSLSEFLRQADQAMYTAKSRGRNQTVVFDAQTMAPQAQPVPTIAG